MRDAISLPSGSELIEGALHSRAATRLAARADELAERVDLSARTEALAEGARPLLDRARGRRPRHRTRTRLLLLCALLAAIGA
ncbi:MAG: hypothetical protein O3B31_11440, partial [Chloroflexi bacterium]|nr:hypothetical protein [Chloroflexota bacterium]